MKIPSKLPGSLARSSGTGSLFVSTGFGYNYVLGGKPFLSAASHQQPVIRETHPVTKNQFDNQNNPGEQTLSGWWIRSQQSFHGGAGQTYGDPAALNVFTSRNEFNQIRFFSSRGVDVWTQGQASLLSDIKKANGSPVAAVLQMVSFRYGDGTDAAFGVTGTTFKVVLNGSIVTPGTPPSASVGSCATDGTKIIVAAKDGVWTAPIPATTAAAWTWTKQYTVSTTKAVQIGYVKNRLILGVGPALYQLSASPAGAPAALPTANFTNDDPSWVYTAVTESSQAIYAVGGNGVQGSVLKLVLDSAGALPTLTAASVACQFPAGEVVYSAMGYMGGYVGLGTNKGVRVAQVSTNGDLTYGPLLFTTDGYVRAWSARDRFLWCTVSRGNDGDSGLYRVDLSTEIDTLRFAYATDLVFAGDTTDCYSVAHMGSSDSLAFSTATDTYQTDTTKLFAGTAYLRTSRIRYNTLEPKLFKFIRVRGPVLAGSLSFAILDQNDSNAGTVSFASAASPGDSDYQISSPTTPQDFVSVKFSFTRSVGAPSTGPSFYGYQLKSLPGSPKQRVIQLPLFCFDSETDAHGNTVFSAGSAFDRLSALEALDTAGDVVILQDLDTGVNTRVIIDRVSFQQTSPPPKLGEWGGIVTVTMRTV